MSSFPPLSVSSRQRAGKAAAEGIRWKGRGDEGAATAALRGAKVTVAVWACALIAACENGRGRGGRWRATHCARVACMIAVW